MTTLNHYVTNSLTAYGLYYIVLNIHSNVKTQGVKKHDFQRMVFIPPVVIKQKNRHNKNPG